MLCFAQNLQQSRTAAKLDGVQLGHLCGYWPYDNNIQFQKAGQKSPRSLGIYLCLSKNGSRWLQLLRSPLDRQSGALRHMVAKLRFVQQ